MTDDTTRLWITIVRDREGPASSERVVERLRDELGYLDVTVAVVPQPPGEFGPEAPALVVTLHSGSVARALAASLTEYVHRHPGTTIAITSESGSVIEIGGEAGTRQAARIVEVIGGHRGSVRPGEFSSGSWNFSTGGAAHNYSGGGMRRPGPDRTKAETLPISIYLADEAIHVRVESAVEQLLAAAGLRITSRDDPIVGSWFRRMWASVKAAARTPAGRDATLTAAHAAEVRLVLAPDAEVTAKLLQGVGPVITALEPTRNAVIRLGNVLIVKVEGDVTVTQLTPAQQFLLNHRPQLASAPHAILAALQEAAIESGNDPPAHT